MEFKFSRVLVVLGIAYVIYVVTENAILAGIMASAVDSLIKKLFGK